MPHRWLAPILLLLACALVSTGQGQLPGSNAPPIPAPSGGGGGGPLPGAAGVPAKASDLQIVEKLIAVRRDYQTTLESLRLHYIQAGDVERTKWAEEELRQYHRIPKYAFRPELDAPPPNLQANLNVTEANKLYTRAMSYKDKGFGTDYVDNQRRAEILFQELITKYPQSDKISDTAFQLGTIYESRPYKMPRRAAQYYERCFQWNPKTSFDARMRAARIYDRQLQERGKAQDLYKEVGTHETDPKRLQEAEKRLNELTGKRL